MQEARPWSPGQVEQGQGGTRLLCGERGSEGHLLYQSRQERGAAGPGVAVGQRAEGRVGLSFAYGRDAGVNLAEI